jgi:hypothetical protein
MRLESDDSQVRDRQLNEPGAGICFQKSSDSPACFFLPFLLLPPFFGISRGQLAFQKTPFLF